jgi:hypothetical protein
VDVVLLVNGHDSARLNEDLNHTSIAYAARTVHGIVSALNWSGEQMQGDYVNDVPPRPSINEDVW